MSSADALRRIGEGVLDLFFPPRCPFCASILPAAGICDECRESLPWTAEAESVRTLPDGALCAVPLRYEGAVRKALLRAKFSGSSDVMAALGTALARFVEERFPGGFDAVTWAPVSSRRLRTRGYDQSELLAKAVCRRWRAENCGNSGYGADGGNGADSADGSGRRRRAERLLIKIRDNPPQSSLNNAEARRKNVLGVYAVPSGAAVRARNILLIDDICTTGATLSACRETLLLSGAASVVCAVAATASLPDGQGGSGGSVGSGGRSPQERNLSGV